MHVILSHEQNHVKSLKEHAEQQSLLLHIYVLYNKQCGLVIYHIASFGSESSSQGNHFEAF